MGRLEKRSASSDVETEDSGFGSNHSPPFAKSLKRETDSIPGVNHAWTSFAAFNDRRAAFSLANNLNNSHHINDNHHHHIIHANNENSCKLLSSFTSNVNNNINSSICLFTGKYGSRSRDGRIDFKILAQPEEQHRARYMTEGKNRDNIYL